MFENTKKTPPGFSEPSERNLKAAEYSQRRQSGIIKTVTLGSSLYPLLGGTQITSPYILSPPTFLISLNKSCTMWSPTSPCLKCRVKNILPAGAAITEHSLGGLNDKYSFLTVPEVEESKVQEPAWLGSSENSPPAYQKLPSSCAPENRETISLMTLLIRALIPFRRAPPSWPNHLIILSHWVLSFNIRTGAGRHKHSAYSNEGEGGIVRSTWEGLVWMRLQQSSAPW